MLRKWSHKSCDNVHKRPFSSYKYSIVLIFSNLNVSKHITPPPSRPRMLYLSKGQDQGVGYETIKPPHGSQGHSLLKGQCHEICHETNPSIGPLFIQFSEVFLVSLSESKFIFQFFLVFYVFYVSLLSRAFSQNWQHCFSFD